MVDFFASTTLRGSTAKKKEIANSRKIQKPDSCTVLVHCSNLIHTSQGKTMILPKAIVFFSVALCH